MRNVSIIIPIYNGEPWIEQCFTAILNQTALGVILFEVCVCDDSSNDNTSTILQQWAITFRNNNINLTVFNNKSGRPKGVGWAKNRAVSISSGTYLCFQDIDDIMLPDRILVQYNRAVIQPDNTIIGSRFRREPLNSTPRFTFWANSLSEKQLYSQIYTSNGPTIIMPTWFCHKSVFEKVGGFDETGKGTPEDLVFFFKHLNLNGKLYRVDEVLLTYYYHNEAATKSVLKKTIWDIAMVELQENILSKWTCFTVWNAGKQGKKFYHSLNAENKKKVAAFCDVDERKIGRNYAHYESQTRSTTCNIPIVDFKNAKPPLIICMKQDMTNGQFESNLASLKLQEREDYVFFG